MLKMLSVVSVFLSLVGKTFHLAQISLFLGGTTTNDEKLDEIGARIEQYP
jgi:hypothetical protein